MAEPSTSTRYHQYIPQFILRNFAHGYKPPKNGKRNRGTRPGEQVLSGINLAGAEVEITETLVKRTFGIQDLYIDTGSKNEQHVEEMLSRLEGRAAAPRPAEVTLARTERDTLRKFLFIQLYRQDVMKKAFACKTAEGYVGDDKEEFIEYMRKKGFQRPIDVWLDNIKQLIEVKMETPGRTQWLEVLKEKMYPPDAMQFFLHTGAFYLAICTPKDSGDEFIMTENGPGNTTNTICTQHHFIAHISPKLTLVLRSGLLPHPAEDIDEDIKDMREKLLQTVLDPHGLSKDTGSKSFLHDLPVTKARDSYTRVVDGRTVSLNGQQPVLSVKDRFFFKFFRISTEHVNRINTVLLEEAFSTSRIVFNSKKAARRTLEYYLKLDIEFGFKAVKNETDDRVVYLRKVEEAVKLLGGDAVAKYRVHQGNLRVGLVFGIQDEDQVLTLVKRDPNAMNIYTKLSNKKSLDPEDFEQAARMLALRIKTDTWAKGHDEAFRDETRSKLRTVYCELPAQRVWLYLKRTRFMLNGGTELGPWGQIIDSKLPAEKLSGPEDVIAKVGQLFVPPHLCRIMYFANLNDGRIQDPEFGVGKEGVDLDKDGIRRLRQEISLAFGQQGSICDCATYDPTGIPQFEKIARTHKKSLRACAPLDGGAMSEFTKKFISEEEKMELLTRVAVQQFFTGLLKPGLEGNTMKDLLDVLFNTVFPVFEGRGAT
ncbi:hypothetical protein LARI1_G005631 [Lachnellula arida]|uniref:DUF4238 domain-containing protein n=1 Tax=Lachnellula arida TaxID=1316785 RepID=A0A8T9B7Y5_9HELO|nr:hypothetical protein LARI1_G005631 [Lachnellula arida]